MKRNCTNDELYFITLTVVEWVDVFTRREYKDFLIDNLKYCQEHKGLEIYEYAIMSNHIHLIARSSEGDKLSDILRDFKTYTSKSFIQMIDENVHESRRYWMIELFAKNGNNNERNKEYQFWQNGNHATQLFTSEVVKQKINYIHNNPIRAGWVNEPSEYIYCSANPLSPLKTLNI